MLLMILTLSCCSSQNPNFYQPISIKTSEIDYPQFNKTVLLKTLILPAEVARPQITTQGKDGYSLKIDEFNRWGASPDKLFQNALRQDLNAYLPNAQIEVQTPLKKNYQYAVAVEINTLSGQLNKEAILEAEYIILNSNGKSIKSGKLKESIAIKRQYADYVIAQSHMLSALAAQIAADLNNL